MRRMMMIALVTLIGWMPLTASAQTAAAQPAPPPMSDFGAHPAMAVVGGMVSGLVLASAVSGVMVTGSLLMEGASLGEALETGSGLGLPAIGASAVLGGLVSHFLFSR